MNWRYTINIKDQFEKSTTPELIVKLCTSLVTQINKILKDSQNSNILEESINDFWYDLEEVKDNFEFLQHLTEGVNITEEFDIERDYETDFNGCLDYLYDVADTKIILKNNEKQKLIWVR